MAMVYPNEFENKIGFNKIRKSLAEYCQSEMGRIKSESFEMLTDYETIQSLVNETNEFRQILLHVEPFPNGFYFNLIPSLKRITPQGSYLTLEELFDLKRSLETVKAILKFLKTDEEAKYPYLGKKAKNVQYFIAVTDKINQVMTSTGKLKDNASPDLQKIRKEIKTKQSLVSKKLQSVLKNARQAGWVDQDTSLAIRNGRLVLPVPSNIKRQVKGFIHDESATGKTSFIEPAEAVELNNNIRELEYAEQREIIKILIDITSFVRPYRKELIANFDFLGDIDFIQAKAMYARSTNSSLPVFRDEQVVQWKDAVHPLLFLAHQNENKLVVPLNLELNHNQRVLLISGPNAGGKSVCLQTTALLQYMFQCGMLVSMSENSVIGKFNRIFLDMGDDQSIDNDLSTYSSHLNNMKYFIKNADKVTLLLIDEFGSGTEPTMGGAIAESVLEKLNAKKCFGVITTHYANLKHFAASGEGIVNGAMLYDHNKLEPLFKLEIGKPGNSFAFEIARKLGMPEDVLQAAAGKIGQDYMNFEKHIREALRDKRYWERKRQQVRKNEKNLESALEKTRQELDNLLTQKKEIIKEAKAEAKSILDNANKQIENTIREIKEAGAEKEKTRQSRERIEVSKKLYDGTGNEHEQDEWLARKKKNIEQQLKKKGKNLPVEKEQPAKPMLKEGLKVRLEGQDVPGEVLEMNGKKAMVAFGNMITSVSAERLIPVSENEFRRQNKSTTGSEKTYNVYEKRLHFKAQVDIRGKRAEEALQIVSKLVDEALMLNTKEIKILHGKGNGILRQMIRDYLKSVPGVLSYKDEKVEFGGTGITVVNLDT